MNCNELVVVRGGGDLASGTIYKLHKCGFRVLILELANPTSIRRKVSFSEAIYDGKIEIEGITSVFVNSLDEMRAAWNDKEIPVVVDLKEEYIKILKPEIFIDATVAKKNLGTSKDLAKITIALGPGFTAGKDVDVVIETARGHDLGRLIFHGEAKKNSGIPGKIEGFSKERVIHSPKDGKIENLKDIGAIVEKDEILAYVGDVPVRASLSGLLRGIIRSGSYVKKGLKIADIDPRISERDNCFTISDKARSIAGGVLEAILYLKQKDCS